MRVFPAHDKPVRVLRQYPCHMKQIWITKAGNVGVLQVREAPDLTPGPGEVAIDVKAAGVNFADVLARVGMYPDAPPIPCVVGYEVAGTVAAVGPRVAEGDEVPFAAGDRVVALTRFGGYSTKVAVPAAHVFAMPDAMSFAEAAAIPVNYFTAYLAVVRFGNLQRNERILIHNAGGGVGIAAAQIARDIGARVLGTASAWKHERLLELGVDHAIDYRTHDWERAVMDHTAGGGVHVVVDPIGGRNLKKDLRVLAPLGRLIGFGFSEPVRDGRRSLLRAIGSLIGMPRPHFVTLLNSNWMVGGLNLGHLWSEIDRLRGVGEAVLDGWSRGALRPVIHARVPFDDPAESHRLLQERENLGKVVLDNE